MDIRWLHPKLRRLGEGKEILHDGITGMIYSHLSVEVAR